MKVVELYSGIGGMHFALKGSGINNTEVILAVDINPVANLVYRFNFPKINLIERNIQSFTAADINKLSPEILLMSPPCQPFTRTGIGRDIKDERTDSLLHVMSLLPQLSTVKYILLENVKGFETSEMHHSLLTTLKSANFTTEEFLLSPHQFNVCNTRLRYYLLAKRSHLKDISHVDINDRIKTNFGRPISRNISNKIKDILEFDSWNSTTGYAVPERLLQKYFRAIDITCADSNRSCCFTKAYTHYMKGTGSVLSALSETKTNEIDVKCVGIQDYCEVKELIKQLNIRYFTPKEVSRLMNFPEEFNFPPEITNRQKYRLLGNSINVFVVSQLITYLLDHK